MWSAEVTGRFAREALAAGQGEVCAVFRRSFYLRSPGERYACLGDASLGHGPLNVLVSTLPMPALGERLSISLEQAAEWRPPAYNGALDIGSLTQAARSRVPAEGLGGLVIGAHNALSGHAQPALEALERWLVGNALSAEAEALIGLGPGVTASGDDYLGGLLLALGLAGRGAQGASLWRWLEPRLAGRTREISAAHLAAAAAGEAQEALHRVLNGEPEFGRLDSAGWNGLAGALSVAKTY
jgi:hypothetical protein